MRKWLVTGLGAGYLPIAPGTWGSAAAALVYFLCFPVGYLGQTCVLLGILIAFSIFCVAFGGMAEKLFGKKDPGQVTSDEWAGQAVALLLLPAAHTWTQAAIIAGVGFFLFRISDIIKPPPARQAEALPRGWGMLIDDLIAGVYANIAGQLLLRLGLAFLFR